MRMGGDIHYRERKLKRLLERLKKSKEVSAKNRSTLRDFYNYCCAEGLSTGRIEKLICILFKLSKWLRRDFEEAGKDDIIELVRKIEEHDFADWTKYDYKFILKKFYKWLRNTEDHYPEEVRWIKPRIKNKRMLPEELLTEDDVDRLVKKADNLRDKALILTLYESGCRIGELASLRIKNVEFDRYGAVLIVSGKTGDRRLRLVNSAPVLANWIDNHPDAGNPDAPLWVGIGTKSRDRIITYNSINMMIKKVAKRAGIKKKVNPHMFRHSRATLLAKHLTEAQLKQMFGWTQSSGMAATYVHLSGRDTDDAILKLHGIKSPEKEEIKLKPRKCPRCKFVNSSVADFCNRCGMVLKLEVAAELEDERRVSDDLLTAVLKKSPDLSRRIVEAALEMGLKEKLKEMV
jgi:integrase